ncbi:MAG: hypothetical protein RLZZ175_2809 [Bacteroidota bacterium]|jgi:hypothetical protein
MNKNGYSFINNTDLSFSFVSKGKQGEILKVVVFQEIGENIFNIALLDYLADENKYSDMVRSDNGDMKKVLITVMNILLDFLQNNPQCILYLEGNTRTKRLLYNRIINNNYQDIKKSLVIIRENNDNQENFVQGNFYNSFYVALQTL